jgi:hypothetical protein
MMADNPLTSLTDYSRFVIRLLQRPSVELSTVAVWSASRYTGIAEGDVLFAGGIRLRLREELDFDAGLITSYVCSLPSSIAASSRERRQQYGL